MHYLGSIFGFSTTLIISSKTRDFVALFDVQAPHHVLYTPVESQTFSSSRSDAVQHCYFLLNPIRKFQSSHISPTTPANRSSFGTHPSATVKILYPEFQAIPSTRSPTTQTVLQLAQVEQLCKLRSYLSNRLTYPLHLCTTSKCTYPLLPRQISGESLQPFRRCITIFSTP